MRPLHAAALVAAGLAVGSASGATAATVITGRQIKDNTITSRDIRNGTIRTRDLAKTARPLRGARGPAGATGPQGPAGPVGPEPSWVGVTTVRQVVTIPDGGGGSAEPMCPSGSVISGGYRINNGTAMVTENQRVGSVQWSVRASRADAFTPGESLTLDVTAVCGSVTSD